MAVLPLVLNLLMLTKFIESLCSGVDVYAAAATAAEQRMA